MAYDSLDCIAPRVNVFSNPDVSENDKKTGDDEHNNAQTIRNNKVRLPRSTPHVSLFELV